MDRQEILLESSCGKIRGLETERCRLFLGVPYAKAGRFAYAAPTDRWEGELDATAFGQACPQNRGWHEHLEDPMRRFYKKEFREGRHFEYGEDCLNLNIYAPKDKTNCPVVLFFHGGGFDSGVNSERPFDGSALAARGVVAVFANYRVGPLGFLTHENIQKEYGRDGNFGLDDQLTAIRWVRDHIASFGGNGDNITLLGQSAGAISIQYHCLNPDNTGLFRHAAMMSGGGMFPRFALPRRVEDTHEYWLDFIQAAGCTSLDELRNAPLDAIFDAVETMKRRRKDNVYNTMPVIDGLLIPAPVDKLIASPLPIDYLIGFTNTDMYAPVMAFIGKRYAHQNGAWLYYFDMDAPGDSNGAFHSCDLRYIFETLSDSWRPYSARDYEASAQLSGYLVNFARTGNPNGPGLPLWKKTRKGGFVHVLRFAPHSTAMGHANYVKMTYRMLKKGDPKA